MFVHIIQTEMIAETSGDTGSNCNVETKKPDNSYNTKCVVQSNTNDIHEDFVAIVKVEPLTTTTSIMQIHLECWCTLHKDEYTYITIRMSNCPLKERIQIPIEYNCVFMNVVIQPHNSNMFQIVVPPTKHDNTQYKLSIPPFIYRNNSKLQSKELLTP